MGFAALPDHLRMFAEWHEIPGQGAIQLIAVFGDEEAIDQVARTTSGADDGEERTDAQRRGLMRRLMRDKHTSPIEFCEIVLRLDVPMDTWRQWVRHRTANINEHSTRYSPALEGKSVVVPGTWRMQSTNNRQGSDGFVSASWDDLPDDAIENLSESAYAARTIMGMNVQDYLTYMESRAHDMIDEVYKERLVFGVAREQARKDLTLSQMTRVMWKIDLHNLLHFLSLRVDEHAQLEIREYANFIREVVKAWVPDVHQAFTDYVVEAHTFSRQEMDMIRAMVAEYKAMLNNQTGESKFHLKWRQQAITYFLGYDDPMDFGSERERAAFWRTIGII